MRAKYDGRVNTIDLNYLSYDGALWYSLANIAAAKNPSGKRPKFLKRGFSSRGHRKGG